MQLHLRFGRLPFWLSRVDKRLPNTTVVHIYFLFYDISPQNPLFFSSANHQSIIEKNDFSSELPNEVLATDSMSLTQTRYFLIGQLQERVLNFRICFVSIFVNRNTVFLLTCNKRNHTNRCL